MTSPLRHLLGRMGGHRPHAPHRSPIAAGKPAAAAATVGATGGAIAQNNTQTAAQPARGNGPPGWPDAYEDVLGYTFWPNEYAGELQGHGFDVIAQTIIAPGRAMPETTGSAARDQTACRAEAKTADTNWPATQVEQTVQLSGLEHKALERLQAATVQSTKAIEAGCQDAQAARAVAAPERLASLTQALWRVHDAAMSVRTPVQNFYDSLPSATQAHFVRQDAQAQPSQDDRNKAYQACAPRSVEAVERLIKEIEQRVRPNPQQKASVDNLHKVSADMGKLLLASCMQPVPADPVARLDAAGDHLTAMIYAATTMQIALSDLYGQLDDQQKARLDRR